MAKKNEKTATPPKPQRPRAKPRVAIAFIDTAAAFLENLRAHVAPDNNSAQNLLTQIRKCHSQATVALGFQTKPPSTNPNQTKLPSA